MAMRYLPFLFLLGIITNTHAAGEKEAKDALTKAIMKIPLMNESRKFFESKVRQSDFKFLFYLGPI